MIIGDEHRGRFSMITFSRNAFQTPPRRQYHFRKSMSISYGSLFVIFYMNNAIPFGNGLFRGLRYNGGTKRAFLRVSALKSI